MGKRGKYNLQLLLVALESATRVLSRDKPLLQLYINNEINALSSLYNIQVVNQLVFYRFIFFPSLFFLLFNFFRFSGTRNSRFPNTEQIMQIHWKRKAFLVFFLLFFLSSFSYLCLPIRFAFVYSLATHMKFFIEFYFFYFFMNYYFILRVSLRLRNIDNYWEAKGEGNKMRW